ncbi:lyase family protein [Croceicoccus sp. YJ47]|uniref:lyase family protein n=1 Tax=Croceicoccus sp. YJ47 TaxID=2798724 RepID=UPI001EFF4CEF|nr:lyase family protein [Croceicoccus sp. YJ47]
MLDTWSDDRIVAHALAFESALAEAQAKHGVIAREIARSITDCCATSRIDPAAWADEAALAGTLAIPLVRFIRNAVPDAAKPSVHRGATSQDVADSVMMMQVREGARLITRDASRVMTALSSKAREHAATPTMGRTLLQDALPIALGLRIAQWHAGIAQARDMFADAVETHAVLQLGGPVGTRAAQGGNGAAIADDMAARLGLRAAPPWHARRNGPASIAASLAMLIGAVGKMARDVALMSQNAIGEAREPAVEGRGGSSAMAHKRNPTGCQTALSAAGRAPGLAATMLGGLSAELERGLGGWQAEAPVMAELFLLAAGALSAMADVAEGLEIDCSALAGFVPEGPVDLGESAKLIEALLTPGKEN